MEKTAEEILKITVLKFDSKEINKPITDEIWEKMKKENPDFINCICTAMHEYATLKSSQDNKALQEVIDFYVESTKDYKALSDMRDKLAEQPNEIEVGNLVIDKLKHDEYWSNPRNRKTRIVVEIMLREMYLTGWNNKGEKIQTEYNTMKGGKDDK